MSEEFKDLLKVEGINFKGFGIIPKLIMFDRNLSLEAKAIYAYFASYAGNGTSSFPGRDYILKQLKMSKDAYYRHYNQLINEGYIRVERNKTEDGVFANNIYTLVSNPPNIENVIDKFNITNERIRFTGIKSLGYGMIPKAIMIDERLSVKAKGIYAYFASYTGSGNSSFPKRSNILFHLNISETTYYTHYNQLIEFNYITTKQRSINGKLSVNDYFLVDNPDELAVENKDNKLEKISEITYPKKQDMGKCVGNSGFIPYPKKQDMEIQYMEKQDMKKPYMEKQDTNSNSINKNNINNNSVNINIPSFEKKEGMKELEKTIEEIEKDLKENKGVPYYYAKDKTLMEKTIKHLTQYDYFKDTYKNQSKQEIYNMSISCLVDMVTSEDYTYYKGSKLSYAKVLDLLNNVIDPEDIFSLTYFMESFVEKYIEISEGYEIVSYENHMKSCMIQYFRDYKIEFAVNLNRIIRDI